MIDKLYVRRLEDAAQLSCFCYVEKMSNKLLAKFVYVREVDGVRDYLRFI